MSIWALLPIDRKGKTPWNPYCDKIHGFVISAESESRAREIAAKNGYDENRGMPVSPWLMPEWSSCEEIGDKTPEGVVLDKFEPG